MYYVLSSTKLNQVRDDSLNHPRRPWGTKRRDGEGSTLRDGDWWGRIEALAMFSAEVHGTYADPSTLFRARPLMPPSPAPQHRFRAPPVGAPSNSKPPVGTEWCSYSGTSL